MKLAGDIANDIRNDPKINFEEQGLVFLGIGTFEKAAIAQKVKKEVVSNKIFSLYIN